MAAFYVGDETCHLRLQRSNEPAQFKSNVSEVALLLGESLKYGGPNVDEAIRSGVGTMLTKPTKPELKTINNVKHTEIDIIKEMETYKVKIPL